MCTRSLSSRIILHMMSSAGAVLLTAVLAQAQVAPAPGPSAAATEDGAEATPPQTPGVAAAPPAEPVKQVAGSTTAQQVTQPAPAPEPATLPTETTRAWPLSAWIVGGVGGALLVTGSIAGVIALNKNSELKQVCPNRVCTPATSQRGIDLQDTRDTAVVFADVGIVGGLACLTTAAYLVLDSQRQKGSRSGTGKLQIIPAVGPRAAGIVGTLGF